MKRVCHACRILVDAKDFAVHREAHHNASKPRQTGWGTSHDSLRKECMKRDRGRCVICGKTAAQLKALGLQLHMAHIVDVADGGRDVLSNVRMVCETDNPRGRKPNDPI